MSNLLTNESNLEKIKDKFSQANEEILLCSAWITSSILPKVINHDLKEKIKSGKVKIRILIRLGEKSDVKITDPYVFKLIEELGENAQLRYHKKLHAKMFVVDKSWSMLGSFNLTGGGFGDEERPGSNPEAGFEFTEKSAINEVIQRFEDIWDDPETKEISKNLIGFVMSPSTHHEITILGIRDLPMNMFVQIKVPGEDEYLVGKIIYSEKYDFDFYDAEIRGSEWWQQKDLKDLFGNNDLGGSAKSIASVPSKSQPVKIARVLITNKAKLTEGKLDPKNGLTLNTIPPEVASEVHEADKKLLELIFNQENFASANLFANPEIEVGFDPKELTTKHFSVFGATGSGKSYFVKYMLSNNLYDWYCKTHKGRIIIFDPHNEYTAEKDMPEAFVNNSRKYETIDAGKYKARLIRDIDDIEEAVNIKFSKREEKNVVDKILNKCVREKKSNREFIDLLKEEALQVADRPDIDIEAESRALSEEVDDAFFQYLSELKDLAGKIVDHEIANGDTDSEQLRAQFEGSSTEAKSRYVLSKMRELYGKLSPTTQQILKDQVINTHVHKKIEKYFERDIRIISEEIIEVIEDAIASGEITIEQLDLVKKMNKPKIYRINLAGIHEEDIRHTLTASILTQIFNEKKEDLKAINTVFVIEEAHNFAPEGGGRNNPAARIIKKIASEGRKFNLGLIVVTQRPAYVSKDVLAQCSTQAIFRLINSGDLDQVKNVVEGISETEVNQLPHFQTGQALFAGVGIRQPVIVRGKEIE